MFTSVTSIHLDSVFFYYATQILAFDAFDAFDIHFLSCLFSSPWNWKRKCVIRSHFPFNIIPNTSLTALENSLLYLFFKFY